MKFSFSKKLLVLFAFPLLMIGVIVAALSTGILRNNLNTEIQKELQITADSIVCTYSNLYEGDYFKDQSGKLYKGTTAISSDTSLLDTLKENVGIDTAFIYDGSLTMTSLKYPTGAKASGALMDKDILAKVLEGKPVFEQNYVFQKVRYYGYFTPLINSDGTTVGAVFAGRTAEDVEQQVNTELRKIIIPTIAIMVAFMIIILIFAKNLAGKMTLTRKFLEQVASGHLTKSGKTKHVKSRDEIGDIFKMSVTLQDELYRIVSNIKESTDSLLASSNGLITISNGATQDVGAMKKSMDGIVKDASEQADKASESVENIYNISTQIEYISKEMTDMYDTVNAVSVAEKDASRIMEELNDANQEMLYTIGRIAEQITVTNDSVQAIQQTIDMIRNIADETDLLAVNASIEAAHAGAAGRGFAVIAEQISKLASMSADNAGEVEKTLSSIMDETAKMVQLMEETKQQMDTQAGKMQETVEKFASVAQGVESSLTNVESVNSSMETLDAAKESVLDRVKRLSDISNQFVAAADDMMENTNHMNERMRQLEETANRLEEISEGLCDGLDNFKL